MAICVQLPYAHTHAHRSSCVSWVLCSTAVKHSSSAESVELCWSALTQGLTTHSVSNQPRAASGLVYGSTAGAGHSQVRNLEKTWSPRHREFCLSKQPEIQISSWHWAATHCSLAWKIKCEQLRWELGGVVMLGYFPLDLKHGWGWTAEPAVYDLRYTN